MSTPTYTTFPSGAVTTRSPPFPTIPSGSLGIIVCYKWIQDEKNCIESITLCNPVAAPTGIADGGKVLFVRNELAAATTTTTTNGPAASSSTPGASSPANTSTSTKPSPTKSGSTQLSKSGFMVMAMLFAATLLVN